MSIAIHVEYSLSDNFRRRARRPNRLAYTNLLATRKYVYRRNHRLLGSVWRQIQTLSGRIFHLDRIARDDYCNGSCERGAGGWGVAYGRNELYGAGGLKYCI